MRTHLLALRRARKSLTAVGVAGFVAGVSLFGFAGTAAAVTESKSCDTTVTGKMGEPVYLLGATVRTIVFEAAQEKKTGLNYLFVDPEAVAKHIEEADPLALGRIPDAESGSVKGSVIGAKVRTELEDSPGLGGDPKSMLDHIASRVGTECVLILKASNFPTTTTTTPTPRDGGTGDPGSTPGTDGTTDAPPVAGGGWPSGFGSGDARAPRRDYNGLPSAAPGVLNLSPGDRYGEATGVPGESPEFGVLGTGGPDSSVQNAGNADALAAPEGPDAVQLPMLLAVVALAGVTAALVRTWVLRRV